MSAFPSGTLVNKRYRVVRLLGSGGMGTVYLVQDTLADDFPLALKTLACAPAPEGQGGAGSSALGPEHGTHGVSEENARADGACSPAGGSLRGEFGAMVQFRHPNLARVYDFGETEGTGAPFLTMEYLEGGGLLAWAQGETLEGICASFAQICRALAYVHARGFLHRDLKPGNVLMTGGGNGPATVKLVDFGLLGVRGTDRTPGDVAGTPEYTAPEVFLEQPLGPASDLYSLGVMMYEVVCGRVPFLGKTVESVARQHVEIEAKRLPGRQPAVTDVLWPVIARLLAKCPAERHPCAANVIEAMNECSGLRLPLETRETTEAYFARSPLVGRESELGRLKDGVSALLEARPGRRPLLLEARTGLGKTRLLEELRFDSQLRGVPFFEAACPRVACPPYGPLQDVLCQALAEAGVGVEDRGTDFDAVCSAAGTYAGVRAPVAHAGLGGAEANVQFADTVLRFLSCLGRRKPFVLVLDDVQWIDSATADMILYVARNAGVGRFQLLLAYRDDELGAGAGQRIVEELNDTRAGRVRLCPLSSADLGTMLRGMLGELRVPEAFLEALCRDSGGNPFFAGELLRLYAQEGLIVREGGTWRVRDAVLTQPTPVPSSLRELASRRVGGLPDELARVVRLLAVIGDAAEMGLLTKVLSVPTDRLQGWVEQLLTRGMVDRDAGTGRLRIRHAELGHALYAAMPDNVRREQHGLVGEALEGMGDGRGTAGTGQLARHFLGACDVSRGCLYGLAAARALRSAYANAEALRLYGKVLSLEPHPDAALEVEISEGLADVCRFVGDTGRAIAWCERGLAASRASADEDAQFRLHVTMGRILEGKGDFGEAQRHYDASVALAEVVSPSCRELAGLYDAMALLALRQGQTNQGLGLTRQAIAVLGDDIQNATAASIYTNMAIAHQGQQESEEALRWAGESMVIRQRIGDQEGLSRSLNNKGMLHRSRGEIEEALTCYQGSLGIKVKLGNRQGAAVTHYNIGNLHARRGEFARARAEYERSHALQEEIGDRPGVATALLGIGHACRYTGEYDAACEALRGCIDIRRDQGRGLAFALLELTETLNQMGAYAEAETVLHDAEAVTGTGEHAYEAAVGWLVSARICAARERWGPADAACREALSRFQELDDSGGVAAATLLGAEIAFGQDTLEEADRLQLQAADMERESGGTSARCRVMCLASEIRYRCGDREEALRLSRETIAAADAMGTPELTWRAALVAADVYRLKGRYVSELKACERAVEALRRCCLHIADPGRQRQYLASGGRQRVTRSLASLAGRLEGLLPESTA